MKSKKLKSALFLPLVSTVPIIASSCGVEELSKNTSSIENSVTINDSLLESDKQQIIENQAKAESKIKEIEKMSVNQAEIELYSVFSKIINAHQSKLDRIQDALNNAPQPYTVKILDTINNQFYDKNMGINDDNIFRTFCIDIYIAKSKAIDVPASQIKAFLDQFLKEWDNGVVSYETTKTTLYESYFMPMDTFKYLHYEMMVFPYLFQKTFNVSYASFLENEGNSSSIYYKPELKFVFRIWKTIDMMEQMCLKYNKHQVSDVVKQQYFYKWFKSINYQKYWDKTGFTIEDEQY